MLNGLKSLFKKLEDASDKLETKCPSCGHVIKGAVPPDCPKCGNTLDGSRD